MDGFIIITTANNSHPVGHSFEYRYLTKVWRAGGKMLQPLNFPDEESVAYVYQFNINTNYNSDAEQRACNRQWRPRQIFEWRPATTGLPPNGLQNVPVDLQLVSLRLLDMLG